MELSGGPTGAFSQRRSSRLDQRVRHFDVWAPNGRLEFPKSAFTINPELKRAAIDAETASRRTLQELRSELESMFRAELLEHKTAFERSLLDQSQDRDRKAIYCYLAI